MKWQNGTKEYHLNIFFFFQLKIQISLHEKKNKLEEREREDTKPPFSILVCTKFEWAPRRSGPQMERMVASHLPN